MCVIGRVIMGRLKKWLDRFQINRPINTYNLVYFAFITALLFETKKRFFIAKFSFIMLQNYLQYSVSYTAIGNARDTRQVILWTLLWDPNPLNLLWWHMCHFRVVFSSLFLMRRPIIEVNTVLTKTLQLDLFVLIRM
jgi:hypothetical protein